MIKNKLILGQSLFELVIAIGVTGIVMVVLVSLVTNGLQNAVYSRNQTQAVRYSQAATEWLRGQRDSNITTFIANATSSPPNWCLVDTNLTNSSWSHKISGCAVVTGTIFTREVDFQHLTVSSKDIYRAIVTVTWSDSKGNHSTNSSTDFSDWRQR